MIVSCFQSGLDHCMLGNFSDGLEVFLSGHLHHPPVYMYIRDQTGAREYTYTPTTHREMLSARLRGVGTYQKVPSL